MNGLSVTLLHILASSSSSFGYISFSLCNYYVYGGMVDVVSIDLDFVFNLDAMKVELICCFSSFFRLKCF